MEASKSDSDPLADEPIPTYEEFGDKLAKEMQETPPAIAFKAAVQFMQYLFTREMIMINLLVQKEILTPEEVATVFGPEGHEGTQEAGIKSMTRFLLSASSQGKILSPSGKQIHPDDVLTILHDILDINDKGWTCKTIEAVTAMRGTNFDLRAKYEEMVAEVKRANKARAGAREQAAEEVTLRARHREDRIRRARIYVSQCNIANKPFPTEEEMKRMVNGEIPIPEQP